MQKLFVTLNYSYNHIYTVLLTNVVQKYIIGIVLTVVRGQSSAKMKRVITAGSDVTL